MHVRGYLLYVCIQGPFSLHLKKKVELLIEEEKKLPESRNHRTLMIFLFVTRDAQLLVRLSLHGSRLSVILWFFAGSTSLIVFGYCCSIILSVCVLVVTVFFI